MALSTFLLNDFYTIKSQSQKTENIFDFEISINEKHIIFDGHFVEMPVVPGVCQTQIIKELLQIIVGENLMLVKGSNIKFTGMIIPTTHSSINVEINFQQTEGVYKVDAKLFFETTVFTKFKGEFKAN